jgi:hypothetical protein
VGSKLITTTARHNAQLRRVRGQSVQVGVDLTRNLSPVVVRGPFSGLTPDLDPNLVGPTNMRRLKNVVARSNAELGEVLSDPEGFRQVDSANLPLGDGSDVPATPTTAGTAIVRIDEINRYEPPGVGTGGDHALQYQLTPIVATAGTGTADTGNMYRVNASGVWVHVAPAPSMVVIGGDQLSATRDGRTTSPSMPDSCVAPFGAVNRSANTGGTDNLQSGPILEPAWIYTNDVDEVMVFPSSSADTLAAIHAYEPLCDEMASPDLDNGTSGFKAKSCETWNGRVYFLNTSEAGTRFSQRLRRTAKFTVDPDPTIVGAGFFDVREFQGEGLRIETLGDALAVYFSDGVMLVRATGNPTSPDAPQIVTKERGLLGTHSMCAIGRNSHFGIFTDGWWLLDQSGRWQELGVVNLDGKIVEKWRATFYDNLAQDQRHRIYCYYDQPANQVYIARPTTSAAEPAETWIYDISSDRVFIENYPVTCFGAFNPPSQVATTIDLFPGTIDAATGTIDSHGVIPGFPKTRLHGDLNGYVYEHRRDLEGFDNAASGAGLMVQDFAWRFELGFRAPGGIREMVSTDRVSLEFINRSNFGNVAVAMLGPTNGESQTENNLLTQGGLGDLGLVDYWFRFASRSPGMSVEGSGPFRIRALGVDVWLEPSEPRT